ncbi:hydrogenase maturation nickel metallochaperone HypA [candidate division GN15 bacterium]|nr:hydrogenase maturation nickel metallochaperone HypA [candidate division GN15 bacterium]
MGVRGSHMHEMSLVQQMIEVAEAELARLGHDSRPASLTLSVGSLSGASPEAMRFAFEMLSSTGPWQGCRLEILEPGARCVCADCGAVTEISDFTVNCPQCDSFAVTIEGGRELRLESITLDGQGRVNTNRSD